MPFYRIASTVVHLKLAGKAAKNPPAPCRARVDPPWSDRGIARHLCCGISMALCDFPMPSGGTCDMPLCVEHAHEAGPDRHLCPTHRNEAA